MSTCVDIPPDFITLYRSSLPRRPSTSWKINSVLAIAKSRSGTASVMPKLKLDWIRGGLMIFTLHTLLLPSMVAKPRLGQVDMVMLSMHQGKHSLSFPTLRHFNEQISMTTTTRSVNLCVVKTMKGGAGSQATAMIQCPISAQNRTRHRETCSKMLTRRVSSTKRSWLVNYKRVRLPRS